VDVLTAIILGVIQGLTEFLPVSSSGHLILLGQNGFQENNLLFVVFVHLATALSTLVVFKKEVTKIILGIIKFKWNNEFKFSLKIIISMIPAVIVGFYLDEQINSLFNNTGLKQILIVGSMLIVTSILLYVADKSKRTLKNVSFINCLIIGIAQAFAILPGVSRSGTTIATSVLLGVDREKAARFSFLMVIPLIIGKVSKDCLDSNFSNLDNQQILSLFVGFFAAFITGVIACKWMIILVKNSQLKYFSYYCFLIGLISIIYFLINYA